MLNLAAIVTKGGLIIWSHCFFNAFNVSNVLERVVGDALIEGKPSGNHGFILSKQYINIKVESNSNVVAHDTDLRFKWLFANDLNVIFVIAYPVEFQMKYDDDLLLGLRKLYEIATKDLPEDDKKIPLKFDESVIGSKLLDVLDKKNENNDDFNSKFLKLLLSYETQSSVKKKLPRKFEQTDQFKTTLKASLQKSSSKNDDKSEEKDLEDRLKKLGIGSRKTRGSAKSNKSNNSSNNNNTNSRDTSPDSTNDSGRIKNPPMREKRHWVNGVAIDGPDVLDYSEQNEDDIPVVNKENLKGLEGAAKGLTKDGYYNPLEYGEENDAISDDTSDNDDDDNNGSKGGLFSLFTGMFTFAQTRILTKDDLVPILDKIKEKLIQKNVAEEVASHICEAVSDGLNGKSVGAFKTMTSAVKNEMNNSIKRILTPKTSTDILRDINSCNKKGNAYTIAFIGVNGVGKSTNLSKICYWLLQNRLKILVAACDTFRSGAVEQLKVHQRNLTELIENSTIEVYDKGYGKDPAGIAKEAIKYANENDFDVVLIDTAGRMQDNEPLMRALAKLVTINNPDKIIFVGEALVGNEAISQLVNFNKALKDFSGKQNPRLIDGMVLSKFDTIDDKVGAALNMTYITGQPIFFIGTGQTYTDLRRLNVKAVVDALLQ